MTDKRVALFFDQGELGAQLREALAEHGAQIVHEGPLASFDESSLRSAEVNVLVVNLDDDADDAALDRFYALLDDGSLPVVFNDAQASRHLDGWDRARWARHLAAKALGLPAIDPPRPQDAREVEPAAVLNDAAPEEELAPALDEIDHTAGAETAEETQALEAELEALLSAESAHGEVADNALSSHSELPAHALPDDLPPLPAHLTEEALPPLSGVDFHDELPPLPEAENLAATLQHDDFGDGLSYAVHDSDLLISEADLLAANANVDLDENEFGSGLTYRDHAEELLTLPEGEWEAQPGWEEASNGPLAEVSLDQALRELEDHAAAVPQAAPETYLEPTLDQPSEDSPLAGHVEKPSFEINLDHLALLDPETEFTAPVRDESSLAEQTPAGNDIASPEWGFMDDDAIAASAAVKAESADLEKLSAADYLAPSTEQASGPSPIEPGLSLELVSPEAAVAPSAEYQPVETHLQEYSSALSRLVVLGAARDSTASLNAFLGALPSDTKLPFLLTQHHSESARDWVPTLAAHSALPLRLAAAGERLRPGEVVVVPRGYHARVLRDGSIELASVDDTCSEQAPSIDSSFTMAANMFGRSVLGIVFAGRATDAVAGAQAIHDRGGRVWVEAGGDEHPSDMVNGVSAERVTSFSGTPQQLAARVSEDFA